MKKIAFILGLVVLVVAVGGFAFYKKTKAVNQVHADQCRSFQVDQKLDVDAEKTRLEKLGLKVDIGQEPGAETKSMLITTPEIEPAACEVRVRNGLVIAVQ
jgi:hypothetical protein